MKRLLCGVLAAIMGVLVMGCSKGGDVGQDAGKAAEATGGALSDYPQLNPPRAGETIAIMDTNYGEIRFVFYPQYAPKAVENFLTHAKDGYYDGVIFHRVMPGFMIQGGDPLGTGTGGESIWGKGFGIEVDPHVRHFDGALAMAQSSLPDSIGSQFYIVNNHDLGEDIKSQLRDLLDKQDEVLGNDENGNEIKAKDYFPTEVINKYLEAGGAISLDFNYTVFGQVYEGFDVVEKIANVPVDASDPQSPRPLEDVVINKVTVTTY